MHTVTGVSATIDNAEVAARLDRVAELLEAQAANPYRVQAYRRAAAEVRRCERPLTLVAAEDGAPGVQQALGLGPLLTSVILELVETGRLAMLDRLEGEVSPEDLFMTLPGMGVALARRAHTMLGIQTLEELEQAAADGRLQRVPGFGARRAQLVREALAGRLASTRRRRPTAPEPPVDLLLAIDAEYRHKAQLGELTRIRPRRFNPAQEAWLPIWHLDRDGWAFTAMFSNSARAHALGTTGLWVLIFYERDGGEGQCTVVTEPRGPLAGLRVVRGRERECAQHYHRALPSERPPPPVQEELAI